MLQVCVDYLWYYHDLVAGYSPNIIWASLSEPHVDEFAECIILTSVVTCHTVNHLQL